MKTLITRIKRLALALCLATPIVSWAATSTYSTYSNDTDTPSAGGAYSDHQRFQLNADWMFLADGTDAAASTAAVNLESIAVKWASSTHNNADIGGNSNPQPDAYLVLTTPQDVIVGISAVNDAKWVANGTSTFAFTHVVVSPNAQYYFYFATDVSGLAVGAAMPSSNKKNGRVLCAWHGSAQTANETVRIGASNQYSINCSFVISEASATAVTTEAEAVNLATGTDPVVVTGAVADGVVNVASGAEYPSVTVVGEATTLKLEDSITATYLYLPATTTIDASDVEIAIPGSGETTKETILVSGTISSESDPSVTLPDLPEGYSYEPLDREGGIKVVVSKPVDATITLDGTEQKWSEVKPEGWVNSSVPVIYIDNSVAGTLIFDGDVQAAKININGAVDTNPAVNFVRGNGVNVNIPLFASSLTNMRVTFTNFEAIPQTNHGTDSDDQITAAGTGSLTSFPQIGTSTQGAKLILAQPATFTGSGIYVTGSKTIDINDDATISTTRFVIGNNGSTTQTVNQNGGTITVTGNDGPGSTSASVLLGHWNSTSTFKTLGGTFTANNVASRLGWDGTTTWQIGGGNNPARVNVYGIVNGQNGHTGSGTLNIMANGTLNLGAGGIQFSNSGNGGNINLAGGTIDTGAAAVTITNAKTGGTIINQSKTTSVNVDAEKTLTIDAVLSGSGVGTLKKTGAGKLVLAQTATSVGKLLVNAGTVEFNADVNWSTSGSVEVATDGTLNILTAEDVAEGGLLRAGTFIVQGTVQNNGTPVDVVVKSDGLYVAEPAPTTVTVTVPAVANTTVTVKVGEETIGTAAGNYNVEPGSVVTVTYVVSDAYQHTSGELVYNIDTASAATCEPDIVTTLYVARNNNVKFTTVAAAIANAKTSQNPMVSLLANISDEDIVVDTTIMLMGSYTISSSVTVSEGGQLQVMGTMLDCTLTIEEDGVYATNGGTLNELVTKDGAAIQLTTLSETAAPLSVTSLSVEGNLTIISSWGSAVRGTYYKALSYVTADADIAEGATVDSVNEWAAKVEEDGDNTIVYLAITKVATVDGVYYDVAQDAVDAAVESGKPVTFLVAPGTVKLGAGETLVVSGATLPTVALDDGLTTPPYEVVHTVDEMALTNTYSVKAYVAQITRSEYSQELGPQNVVYKFESVTAALEAATVGETVKVIADYTNASGEAAVFAKAYAVTLDLNGCTITGTDGVRINAAGPLTITDTSVSGLGKVVATADDGVALWARNGSAIVNAGSFQNNSIEEATVYVGYNNATQYDGQTVTITGGDFTNLADYKWGTSDYDYCSLNVVNKEFFPVSAISVTGGTFSYDPAKGDDNMGGTFVASGYAATEDNGVWTVAEKQGIDPESVDPQPLDVDPEAGETAAQEAAEAQMVTVTTEVANVLEAAEVPADTYQGYFTKTAVRNVADTAWLVKTEIRADIVEDVNEDAVTELTEAIADTTAETVTVTKIPVGLYYKVESLNALGGDAIDSATGLSGVGGAPTVDKPTADGQGFIRVTLSASSLED